MPNQAAVTSEPGGSFGAMTFVVEGIKWVYGKAVKQVKKRRASTKFPKGSNGDESNPHEQHKDEDMVVR